MSESEIPGSPEDCEGHGPEIDDTLVGRLWAEAYRYMGDPVSQLLREAACKIEVLNEALEAAIANQEALIGHLDHAGRASLAKYFGDFLPAQRAALVGGME